MINYKQILNLFTVLFIAVTVLSSCGDNKKSADKIKKDVYDQAEKEIMNDIDRVVHDMPEPSEVPYMLQATGSDFNINLINKLENAEKYHNSADKSAMNLGVYATDIAYLSSYDQVQDALKYMEACQKIASQVGVASAFNLDMMERFETNLANKDSLSSLVNETMTIAREKLESLDRLQTVALILSGSYIEGLYLSVMVIDTYPDDLLPEASKNLILEPLIKVIIDQEKPLLDIIKLLKEIEGDDTIAGVVAEFDILEALYKADLAEINKKISEGDPHFMLNKDMLVDVIAEVKRIRADITK